MPLVWARGMHPHWEGDPPNVSPISQLISFRTKVRRHQGSRGPTREQSMGLKPNASAGDPDSSV